MSLFEYIAVMMSVVLAWQTIWSRRDQVVFPVAQVMLLLATSLIFVAARFWRPPPRPSAC